MVRMKDKIKNIDYFDEIKSCPYCIDSEGFREKQ
jgi:hypothetical protein